jgi:hypothetical protein
MIYPCHHRQFLGSRLRAWMLSLFVCCATSIVLPPPMCLAMAKLDVSTRGQSLPEDEGELHDLDRLLAAPQRKRTVFRFRVLILSRPDFLALALPPAPERPVSPHGLLANGFPLRC